MSISSVFSGFFLEKLYRTKKYYYLLFRRGRKQKSGLYRYGILLLMSTRVSLFISREPTFLSFFFIKYRSTKLY